MSRTTDIEALRAWRVDDPSLASLIERVCNHAVNSTMNVGRDWGAVRAQAAATYFSVEQGSAVTAVKRAAELVEELKRTEQ